MQTFQCPSRIASQSVPWDLAVASRTFNAPLREGDPDPAVSEFCHLVRPGGPIDSVADVGLRERLLRGALVYYQTVLHDRPIEALVASGVARSSATLYDQLGEFEDFAADRCASLVDHCDLLRRLVSERNAAQRAYEAALSRCEVRRRAVVAELRVLSSIEADQILSDRLFTTWRRSSARRSRGRVDGAAMAALPAGFAMPDPEKPRLGRRRRTPPAPMDLGSPQHSPKIAATSAPPAAKVARLEDVVVLPAPAPPAPAPEPEPESSQPEMDEACPVEHVLPTVDRRGAAGELIVFDLETTGGVGVGRIIEMAALNLATGASFETFVDPDTPVPAFITQLTSITEAHLRGAPPLPLVWGAFRHFCGEATLMAHNGTAFDARILAEEAERHSLPPIENPLIDSLALLRNEYPGLERHSLDFLRSHFGVKSRGRAHRALCDCEDLAVVVGVCFPGASLASLFSRSLARCMPFGKHKGVPWGLVPLQYKLWAKRSNIPEQHPSLAHLFEDVPVSLG